MVHAPEGQLGGFSKTKCKISLRLSNSTPRYIYPREIKAYIQTKTYSGRSMVVLFITAQWKQSKGLSTSEWINEWYIRMWEYLPFSKKKEVNY